MEEKKYKNVCVIDDQGFYRGIQRIYRDPRDKTKFLLKPSTIEVDPPSMAKINNNFFAKWNRETHEWDYIKNENAANAANPSEENAKAEHGTTRFSKMTEEEKEVEAMNILTFVRNRRLADTDIFVLRAYEDDKKVPKKVTTYRNELRSIPNNIRDEVFEKPKLSSFFMQDEETVRKTKPSDLIVFDNWPEVPKEISHEL